QQIQQQHQQIQQQQQQIQQQQQQIQQQHKQIQQQHQQIQQQHQQIQQQHQQIQQNHQQIQQQSQQLQHTYPPQQQHLQQTSQQQQQLPPNAQTLQTQQPQAYPRWRKVSLFLQWVGIRALLFNVVCLGVGLLLISQGQTVPGRRLFNYAGPAFWILGALVWFPDAIAAYKGVPGAMLTTRSGLAVQMGAVLIGIANTVGNFVSGQVFFESIGIE
ncbi:hypothetical protein C369_07428, partial [Cryptococcus neoformans A5-35-17]